MSKRSFLLALVAVSAFVVASMVGVWLATREPSVTVRVTSEPLPPPRAEAVAPTRGDPVASGPWGSIGSGGPAGLPTTEATASAAPEHHGLATPLFPASAPGTLEPRRAAPVATKAPTATAAGRESGEPMRGRRRGGDLGGGARGAGRR